jgi:hypothetical protein
MHDRSSGLVFLISEVLDLDSNPHSRKLYRASTEIRSVRHEQVAHFY